MILLGLITGWLMNVKPLKVLVDPILFIMVFPMMLSVKIKDILEVIKSPRAVMLSVAINFTIAPVLAYILGKIFLSHDPMLLLGMILIGLIPTSGMTASWTGLAGGRVQTAVVMMTVNLLISMAAIPIYLNLFMASQIEINTFSIVLSLLRVVVFPLVVAMLTRTFIVKVRGEEYFKSLKPLFGGVSAIGVMAIVWLAIALKAKTIINQPMMALQVTVPLIIFYAVLILISSLAERFVTIDEDRSALVFGTALRNLTIALGMSMSVFGESLAVLLIAIAYVIQLPAAVLYMKRSLRSKRSKISVAKSNA
eukprot:gnl/Carplike_NY0171/1165_a1579_803.p1 GENE.gnl/Carplike_NY0171/1165_a1579_803~~gnl/Carplike_NY0171/1165_a1579_803.p1  ORF type:complete len:309 (-),score=-16.72 gnl/Carplike_NY0171/1165_a1579_803:158-1084(-)